jgi:alkanesulfonate monooxygenase SsuD/methylene tetrahydromethanopterin reductase-like flavin-dependent oxidoreductase (luciferase family)
VHVDVMTVPQPLGKIGDLARRVKAARFSGLLFTETGRTAYLNAAVASQAAPGLELSTGVAVAFPRSPFVTAATAWELQEATGGKFRLGLGTQVRTHVVRRYGVAFERPRSAAARLRERGKGVFHRVPNRGPNAGRPTPPTATTRWAS